ncbi:MAG: hypothetical protein ACREN4_03430 [Candidatus Dormibacteria bacterium]
MDPEQRLIDELHDELRRSLDQMRLAPEERQQLRNRLLESPPSIWARLRPRGRSASPWARGAVAALGACAIAAAVSVPLLERAPASQPPQLRSFAVISPQPPRAAAGAQLAPLPTCQPGTKPRVVAQHSHLSLGPRQKARVALREIGGNCVMNAEVTGPSQLALALIVLYNPTSGVSHYTLQWPGQPEFLPRLPLRAGVYRITVRAGSGPATEIRVTVHG